MSGKSFLRSAVARTWRATPDQRVLGRQVAVARGEERGPLQVGVVVGAPGADAGPADAEAVQDAEKRAALVEGVLQALAAQEAEGRRVALVGPLGLAPSFRALPPGHRVEGGEAHADAQARGLGADALDDGAQEAGPVLEAAAVAAGPVVAGRGARGRGSRGSASRPRTGTRPAARARRPARSRRPGGRGPRRSGSARRRGSAGRGPGGRRRRAAPAGPRRSGGRSGPSG